MAKRTGLAITTLSVDDSGGVQRDVRNGIGSFQFATPRAVQDVTGVDKSAIERLLLLADFSTTLNGFVDDTATSGFHAVFKTVPSTSVARTTTITIAGFTLAPEVLYTDYSWNRGTDGGITTTVPGVLADGTVPLWA
jgi:hypothetical protein